jgi:hypothetical protein
MAAGHTRGSPRFDQKKVANNMLANEPSLSPQGRHGHGAADQSGDVRQPMQIIRRGQICLQRTLFSPKGSL